MPEINELEFRLTKIWQSLLGKRDIGVRDNFWDLGGESLTALRLMHRVEKVFGRSLPASALLHVPTIEELVKLIREAGWSSTWSSLAPIQPRGDKPPFFCVHALGGLVVGFRHLAHHLGEDQPFYGLQAQGMDGKSPVLERVEDMASLYLEEIRTVQPHGPYYLGGLCFGGWIAYEMAQLLHRQSERVALLVMLDSQVGSSPESSRLPRQFRTAARNMTLLLSDPVNNLRRRFLPSAIKRVRKGLRIASSTYVPQPYPGKITYFRAEPGNDNLDSDWATLAAGSIDFYDIAGDHGAILMTPQVTGLAEQLKICLEDAQQEFSSQVFSARLEATGLN